MTQKVIDVPEEARGVRADAFLAGALPDLSRSAAERLLTQGLVTANGRAVAKSTKLQGGERLEVILPDPAPSRAEPQDIPLDIVYEDDDLLVVNKPKGIVVHPAAGNLDGTLVNALLYHCGDSLSGVGGELRPGIVHRIDKDTSGLLVVAKNDRAHRSLAAQIEAHTAGRVYEAVVYGRLPKAEGKIEGPIGRHPVDRKKMAVVPGGKAAVTHYRVIGELRGFTHVECRLETGRTHQIRVHFASIGHPVAGDPLYGPKKVVTGLAGQCLHASVLHFVHPSTGEEMEFRAPLPAYFEDFIRKWAL